MNSSRLKLLLASAFLGLIFVAVAGHFGFSDGKLLLVVSAVIGGYMALNIGANDVANNVGPTVGAQAVTMIGAIVIAAICEASGALIAGGDVVGTVKKGIINPDLVGDAQTFIWLMMAALLAAAAWLNMATAVGAPVSTTHSIVGGVLGAGIAAGGAGIANWDKMGAIAASWVISPVMGGVIAAAFLYLIKRTITYRADKIAAAKRVVPILLALMIWAFSVYLIMKGFKKIWKVDLGVAMLIGLVVTVVLFALVRPLIHRKADQLENTKESISDLFTLPLIFSAGLLSFAHGANDVANAIGPLAAIHDAVLNAEIAKKAAIPFWVMLIGAGGIVVGLALYGPRLIRTVGHEITEMDKIRAFSVAMAAAITVLVASQLGLPVSSTHITVGAVFGVGFLREYLKLNFDYLREEITHFHRKKKRLRAEEFLSRFDHASFRQQGEMLKELKKGGLKKTFTKKQRKQIKKQYRRQLVKRSAFARIIAAWLITVPFSGVIAALLFMAARSIWM
ncbi:MAG TPA: inorganic phosphate transporter [Gammaproteobacteria bacterium]|nr:inorganic phosphate transporter [Gammaproteobacteria bacterium]